MRAGSIGYLPVRWKWITGESGTPDSGNIASGDGAAGQTTRLEFLSGAAYPNVGGVRVLGAAFRAHRWLPFVSNAAQAWSSLNFPARRTRLEIDEFVDVSLPPAVSPHD
jgi:hypothetical protein